MLLALFVLKSLFLVVFLLFLRPCFNLNKIIFFFSVYGCFIECHFASLLFGLLWFVVFVFVSVASASTNLLFLLRLGLHFCEYILFFYWLFLLLLLFNFFCRFCSCLLLLLLHFFHFFLSFFLFFILGFALLIAHFPLNSGWHLPGWLFVLCSNHAITNLLLLNKHFDILRDSLPLLFLIHHRNHYIFSLFQLFRQFLLLPSRELKAAFMQLFYLIDLFLVLLQFRRDLLLSLA